MITIITRYEDTQMPRELESRMWRQLKGAFATERPVFVEDDAEMTEALANAPGRLIFLEPTGHNFVQDIPREGDITLVLSNTAVNNLHFCKPEDAYRIDTPKKTHLYGINAAAIALAYRVL